MAKRILYALQGTGNGHVARAREIIPLLQKMADVDVWLGGHQCEVELPAAPKYHAKGLIMKYNRKGGVSFWRTLFGNNYLRLLWDVVFAPVHRYDLVINDFEFVTSWSCWFKNVPCFQLSHQAAFWDQRTLRPTEKSNLGEAILTHYAAGRDFAGFHFLYDNKRIFPPVIREEVRKIIPTNLEHITVYLPAFHHDELIEFFSSFYKERWEVFSKFTTTTFVKYNVTVRPIANDAFLKSMASGAGVLCGAGFETPAEAMFLGKKLAVIPIGKQYEQLCNAAALAQMGVLVLNKLDASARPKVRDWLKSEMPKPKEFSQEIEPILESIVSGARIPSYSR